MSPPLDNVPAFQETRRVLFPCTVGTLLANIRHQVSSNDYKAIKSSTKLVAKRMSSDPEKWTEKVITSSKEFVDAMHSLHPQRHGIKESYLRVTKSRVMQLLKLNGIEFLSGHCKTVLPDPWQENVQAARDLNEIRLRCLMPFIRNQIDKGHPPDAVDQAGFDAYCVEVDMTSKRKNKLGSKQGAQRDWNYFAKRLACWPKTHLMFASKRDDYLLADDDMPPAIAEFDARAQVRFRGSPGFGRKKGRLRKTTIKSRRYLFRRIISAAVAGGINPDRLKTMADVCDREVLETAFNFILGRRDDDAVGTCDICRMAGLMYAVAEQWVGVTDDELEEYKVFYEDWEHIQEGMSEKNQRLLALFTSDRAIADFLRTPQRVMNRYDVADELSEHDCVQMQMATAMGIVTRTLVRMENLKKIEDGVHLIESGWGEERHVSLVFGKNEVKNEEYLETLLSPRLVAILDTYKERAWFKLKRGAHAHSHAKNYLFPGYGGQHKSASTFGPQLADFVFRETGIRVTPHQFRHLGGYFHLVRFPGDYASVQKMLGHRKLETTIRYYTGTMDRRAAFKKYDGHLDARIDGADAAEAASRKVQIKSDA